MTELLPNEPLTEQELQILRLKAQRLSNKEIADQLILAVSTVKWYIGRIYRKLDVSNRRGAISRANQLGLLQTHSYHIRKHIHNLPAQQTEFIGRVNEIDQLTKLLQEGNRLTTILGAGGIGKTRLAIKVAEQQLIRFSDGVFFVPLAPLDTSDDIFITIAFNLDYQFVHDGRAPKQQLLTYLQDKNLLLIVDNFEHVLEGSVFLSEILSVAPDVVILATSRERLNLHSETILAIKGLNYPHDVTDIGTAHQFDAVKLFVQSANRVYPDFALTYEDINSVVSICKHVDGLPLGIELAARWIDHLSPQDIVEAIKRNLDILQSDYRDMPPRLRSIRATLNYSWQRLSDSDQRILARLAVFKGGFTLHSAQQVAEAELLVLRNLTESSMLRQNPDDIRYDMHPLVQQYAQEKLHASGDLIPTRDAHFAYFMGILVMYQSDFAGSQYITAMNAISKEIDNVRAMWDWGVSSNKFEQLASVIPVISLYYRIRSMNGELIQMLSSAISALNSVPERKEPLDLAAGYQVALGITMATSFGYGAEEVGDCLERARALCDEASNSPHKLPALVGLYNYYHVIAQYERANKVGHAILDLTPTLRDSPITIIAGNYGLSASNLMLGNLEDALFHGEVVLKHFDSSMAKELILLSDVNLGAFIGFWVALAQQVLGYCDQAEHTIDAAIRTARQSDHPSSLALVLGIMPYVCHVRDDMRSMRTFASESIEIAQEHDLPFPLAQASIFYGYSEAMTGNVEQGLSMIDQSMFAFQAIGSSVTEGYFRLLKAEIFSKNNLYDRALDELLHALQCVEQNNERWYEAELHRHLGDVYKLIGDLSMAAHHFQEALTLAQRRNLKWYELRASLSLYNEEDDVSIEQLRATVEWFDEGWNTPEMKRGLSLVRGN